MASLNDPQLHLLDAVKARIAAFTPATMSGRVTGYLVVGGTSGGFLLSATRNSISIWIAFLTPCLDHHGA